MIFIQLVTIDVTSLGINEITDLVYLNNTENILLVQLKMEIVWNISWQSTSDLIVGVYIFGYLHSWWDNDIITAENIRWNEYWDQ